MLSYFISLLAMPSWRVGAEGGVLLCRFLRAIASQGLNGVVIFERPMKNDAIHEVLQGLSKIECTWRLKCLTSSSCLYVVETDIQSLTVLENMAQACAASEVCVDLCVMNDQQVYALWYDVGVGELIFNGSIDEAAVRVMANVMRCSYSSKVLRTEILS